MSDERARDERVSDERELTPEPERDPRLRAALSTAFGEAPQDVDWSALARRTRSAAAFRLRARARQTPWWEHAGKWSRRALPIGALAAAAALLLAVFTPQVAETAAEDEGDAVTTVVTSATPGRAMEQISAGSLDEGWLWSATVGSAATAEEQ
jgi:hypothetical protein